jgi:hypothetical protein
MLLILFFLFDSKSEQRIFDFDFVFGRGDSHVPLLETLKKFVKSDTMYHPNLKPLFSVYK